MKVPKLKKDLLNSYVVAVSIMGAVISVKLMLQVASVINNPLVLLMYVALKVMLTPALFGPLLSIVKFAVAPGAKPVNLETVKLSVVPEQTTLVQIPATTQSIPLDWIVLIVVWTPSAKLITETGQATLRKVIFAEVLIVGLRFALSTLMKPCPKITYASKFCSLALMGLFQSILPS